MIKHQGLFFFIVVLLNLSIHFNSIVLHLQTEMKVSSVSQELRTYLERNNLTNKAQSKHLFVRS